MNLRTNRLVSTHPAQANLVAGFSFNLEQLKDLERICEEAAMTTGAGSPWHDQAIEYAMLFRKRRHDLEAELTKKVNP